MSVAASAADNDLFHPFRLSLPEWRLLGILLAITLVARLSAMGFAYSIDDVPYLAFPGSGSNLVRMCISQGRFTQGFLFWILGELGIMPPACVVLYSVLLSVTVAWVGVMLCRTWKITGDLVLSVAVAGIVCLHPYQAEAFSYRVVTFPTAFGIFLAVWAFLIVNGSWRRTAVATLLLTVALADYQIVLNYFMMCVIGTAIISVAAPDADGTTRSWRRILRDTQPLHRLIVALSAAGLSVALGVWVMKLWHVAPSGLMAFVRGSDVPVRIERIRRLLEVLLWQDEAVMLAFPKVLLLVACGLAVLAGTVAWLRSEGVVRGGLRLLALCVLLLVGALAIIGILNVIVLYWDSFYPRLFSHIGIFLAALLTVAGTTRFRLFRRAAVAAGWVFLFVAVARTETIYRDEARMNMRDRVTANLILERLQSLENFKDVREIAMVGNSPYPEWLPTTQGTSLNPSAFASTWSNVTLLFEISGYPFTACPHPEHQKAAKEYCATTTPWPGAKSITSTGTTAVVCFANR